MALPSVFSSLADRFSSGKKPLTENFLALKLGENAVAATFWQIVDGRVETGEVALIPRTSLEEKHLLKIVDEAISRVSSTIKPEPKKIIFGVSEDWITEGKLHSEKLLELRKLCRELDLSPLGFVAMNEAVENLLRVVEGVPPTAILVGLDKEKLFVTLLRAGKNMGTYIESVTGDLAETLEKAIRKFAGTDYLPSRIIVYDGRSDLELIKQKIVAHPWTKQLPFLHFPKVEILETTGAVKAIAIAGGTQLGGKLDLTAIDWVKDEESTQVKPLVRIDEQVLASEGEIVLDNEEQLVGPELKIVDPQELGFVTEEPQPILQDLPNDPKQPPKTEKPKISFEPMSLIRPLFSKITSLKLFQRESNSSNYNSKKPFKLVIALVISLLLVIILGGGLYFLPRANIIIYVDPKQFNQTIDLVILPNNISTSSGKITGKTIDVNLTTTKKGVVTGKKLVGTKAKGSITIFNSSNARSFPLGTIVSSGGLKFATDNEVSLASSSGLANPSTAVVSVTATDIGENYNISTDSLFTIASLPSASYQGKNSSAFSGGSSHQATVVSKDDQTRLIASASAELESRAREELKSKLALGETLLDRAITSKIDKKKFSRDVDAEADSLTLDLSMIFTGLVFDDQEAKTVFKNGILGELPQGYDLPLSKITSNLQKVNVRKDGVYVLTMEFNGVALPLIDKDSLVKKVTGKDFKSLSQIVKDINGVNRFDVILSPKFIEKIQRLPMLSEKITIEIVTL